MLAICVLIGPQHMPAMVMVGFCSVIGAGLWAQLVEGSPRLLRPFGYYGCILGGFVAAGLAVPLLGFDAPLILAACATAAPLIQAIGRLNCVVQGCCHGKPLGPKADSHLGLRITNPSSRICGPAAFRASPSTLRRSIPFSATSTSPFAGPAVDTARDAGHPAGDVPAVCGSARFVEEAYRGEPQTRHWAGLAEYQWYAIASVIAGAIATILPLGGGVPAIDCGAALRPAVLAAAAAMGLFTAAAMSSDFPRLNRRFARLTG